jgi:hypothetical protein
VEQAGRFGVRRDAWQTIPVIAVGLQSSDLR